MNDEEFDNELSSDDSDYCPLDCSDKQRESASENSDPEVDDPENSDTDEITKKSKRRKKTLKRHGNQEIDEEKCAKAPQINAEEEKRKAEALWAEFLNGTDDASDPKEHETTKASTTFSVSTSTSKSIIPSTKTATATNKIFEFAGETVEVQSKVSVAPKAPAVVAGVKRPGGGGLSSVLNQLTKKNKLSVLDKTKLDWDGFKQNEGITEELQTHNRGREGFLERKDFLQRTDLRQFEIEKNMRMTTRRK